MAIDLERDELLSVRHLYRTRLKREIAPSTLWRWIRKGCRGVKLEAALVGGVWMSTPEAFAAFIRGQTAAALTATVSADDAAPAERSDAKRRKLQQARLM